MNYGMAFSLVMTLGQNLRSRLGIFVLVSFEVVQQNVKRRLQKKHQQGQFRLTDRSVCAFLLMSSVAPWKRVSGVWATGHLIIMAPGNVIPPTVCTTLETFSRPERNRAMGSKAFGKQGQRSVCLKLDVEQDVK